MARNAQRDTQAGQERVDTGAEIVRAGSGALNKELDVIDGEETRSETYMAISQGKGRLGVAYYELDSGNLYVVEGSEDYNWEHPNSSQFPFLRTMLRQVNPTAVYASSRADEALLAVLYEKQTHIGENGASHSDDEHVFLEKSGNFETSAALEILSRVFMPAMPQELQAQERLQFLNSIFSLSNEQVTRSVGGLLRILEREHLLLHRDTAGKGSGSKILLNDIKQLRADGFLILEQATYTALQVFQEERHPSFMGVGAAKEGFSLFGLLNKCITQMGRRLLKTWMTRPILNLEMIDTRLDAVEFLVCDPIGMVPCLTDGLKEVRDVPKMISRLQGAGCQLDCLRDWCSLTESILALVRLREMAASFAVSHERVNPGQAIPVPIRKLVWGVDENLGSLHTLIGEILDLQELEESGEDTSMVVSQGLSPELDEMKRQYSGLQDLLTKVVEAELSKIPACLQRPEWSQQQWSVVLIPQIGYLMQIAGDGYDPILTDTFSDYKIAFQTTDSVYYHTDATEELNQTYGDLFNKIRDIENSILRELLTKVLDHSGILLTATSAVAEVDCFLSFAKAAREQNYFRPKITQENVLQIVNGRHPLSELAVECFVPNSTDIKNTEGRIHLLTGPNYSGKSIYGKQVALITFMAHIGSFVPADSCTIGLTDRIFTRIASRETMNIPQSAFMIDLTQVSNMLHNATPRSLLIIDEFGKGTHAEDGLALLGSTLEFLASKPLPPKVIACTHFSELGDPRHLAPSRHINHITMEYICNAGNGSPIEELVYLYKVVPGTTASSFGIQCGRLAGVDETLLVRAQEVIECLQKKRPIQKIASTEMEARERACIDLVRNFARLDTSDPDQVATFLGTCV
eukprot:scaffold5_cov331-Pavlova_lutheri.AAC.3